MNFKCSICGKVSSSYWEAAGFPNLWARELLKVETYRFARCSYCQYSENLDYKEIDFASEGYSNATLSLEADDREKVLAHKIYLSSQKFFDVFSLFVCHVEIGSGQRLGLLKQLRELDTTSLICAIDPTYTLDLDPDVQRSEVNFFNSVSDFSLPEGHGCSLIFRNSLEYHSPQMLNEIFQKLFLNGGIISFELTNIDLAVQGFSHSYTECRSFYTSNNVYQLLETCGLNVFPVETTQIHGDGRIMSIAHVLSGKQSRNLKSFTTLYALINYLDLLQISQPTDSVLFGLGGRNVMALFNDLKGKINLIYESDPVRRSIKLPSKVTLVNINDINSNMILILLNSRYLLQAQKLFPDNPIVLLA